MSQNQNAGIKLKVHVWYYMVTNLQSKHCKGTRQNTKPPLDIVYESYCPYQASVKVRSHSGDVYRRICAILKIFTLRIGFLVHLHCSPLFSMDRDLATTVSNCSILSPVFANFWHFFSLPKNSPLLVANSSTS